MTTNNLPIAAQNEPTPVTVEAGKTYAWCSCGLSEKQPFCDGKHKTTWTEQEGEVIKTWKSVPFVAESTEELWFCNCKQTKTPPFCDGSHKQLAV